MFFSHYSNKNISPTRTKIMTKNEFVLFFLLSKSRPNITNLSFWRSYWPEGKWVTIKMSFLGSAFHHQFHWVFLWRERQELLLFSLFNIPALQPILQVFCSLGLGFHLICFPSCHVLRLPLLCLYVFFPTPNALGHGPLPGGARPPSESPLAFQPRWEKLFPSHSCYTLLCGSQSRLPCALESQRGFKEAMFFYLQSPDLWRELRE